MKYLVPTDGSEYAERAVRHAVKVASAMKEPVEIHLLNVRMPTEVWEALQFLNTDDFNAAQITAGEEEMKLAKSILEEAGVPYESHIEIGPIAPTIAKMCEDTGCDEVIMGTHGRGTIAALALGSIASNVIHLVKVPVTVIK